MSFELLAYTVITVMGVSVLAELARAERVARGYMMSTVARHGQYEQLTEICAQQIHDHLPHSTQTAQAQRKVHRQVGGLRCHTAIYWIESATTWVNMCEHLSIAKTRPQRWFMVATHCEASWLRWLWLGDGDYGTDKPAQAPTQSLESKPLMITHWLAKS